VNDGYGYGPREATAAVAAKAAVAAEAIPDDDPRSRPAWDQVFATTGNYHRAVAREREQKHQAVIDEERQADDLWAGLEAEAGQ
jgi:hypothetical protein